MHGARTTRTSARVELIAQRRQQVLRAHHLAGQAVADPDGERRRRRLALLDHVEVRIEGRDLVHRRLRQPHLLGERGEMRGREMAVAVLDQVQMLDQQIAPARPVAEQRAPSISARSSIWRPLGWRPSRRLPAPGLAVLADLACGVVHPSSRSHGRYRCASKALPVRPSLLDNNRAGRALRQTRAGLATREIGRSGQGAWPCSVDRLASWVAGHQLLQHGLERVGRDEAAASSSRKNLR